MREAPALAVRPAAAVGVRLGPDPALRTAALPLALVAAVTLAACAAEGEPGRPRLVVSAAASMSEALRACSPDYPGAAVRLSFGGSDELAAQVRRGVRPDLLAAANTALPRELFREGLVGRPVAFATNELVLGVPAGSRLRRLDELARPGVKLAIGSRSVPVGSYTRALLARLPRPLRAGILANVRSLEPDVRGVVGKLTQRAVDAGFVYRSDVEATAGRLRRIALPRRLRPEVTYAAAVVTGARRPGLARRYLAGLRSGSCARALARAGFGPAPRR